MTQSELDVQREQFHRELMRKSLRIAELELLLRHTEEHYQRSMSWRLTMPLRFVNRLARRVRAPKPG